MSEVAPNPDMTQAELPVKLLRSQEEVAAISKETDAHLGYEYRAGKPGQEVTVFGFRHTNNPDDATYFQQVFERSRPDLVLVEGSLNKTAQELDLDLTDGDVISKYGEQAYTAWLARKNGVPVETWDSPEDSWAEVARGMGPDAVKGLLLGNAIGRFQREGWTVSGEAIVESGPRAFGIRAWTIKKDLNIDLTPDDLERIAQKYTGKKIAEMTERDGRDLTNPWLGSEPSLVVRAIDQVRDRHALEVLSQQKADKRSILVTCGASHAVTWEPAISALYGEAERI